MDEICGFAWQDRVNEFLTKRANPQDSSMLRNAARGLNRPKPRQVGFSTTCSKARNPTWETIVESICGVSSALRNSVPPRPQISAPA